jgi:hypothetical protein
MAAPKTYRFHLFFYDSDVVESWADIEIPPGKEIEVGDWLKYEDIACTVERFDPSTEPPEVYLRRLPAQAVN